jgi:adenine-specific DNA-methyltransferase
MLPYMSCMIRNGWMRHGDEENYTSAEKIVVQEVRNITLPRRIVATYDDQQRYCLQSTNTINWKQGVRRAFSVKYVLGVLNSSLLNWYFRSKFRGNNHIVSNQLAGLPLCVPVSQTERDIHEKVVSLVDRMLELNKRKHSGKCAPSEVGRLEREIAATDAEIDELVYKLYGLSAEDEKIIENALAPPQA